MELCLYIPFSMYWDYPAANICFCYAIKHFIILTSLNFSIPCTWNSRFKNYPKDQDCFTKNVTASIQPNNDIIAGNYRKRFTNELLVSVNNFFLSAFLLNFFLCQDCWHGDVPPHLVQPFYVALGQALDSGHLTV